MSLLTTGLGSPVMGRLSAAYIARQPSVVAAPVSTRHFGSMPGLRQGQPKRAGLPCRLPVAAGAASSLYGAEWSTPKDAYLTLGLSHCFTKGDDGKLVDQYVIEPITANSLEGMKNGAKTSFLHVFSLRLEDALQRSKAVLPPEFAPGAFCEEFEARCDASARTWMRPHAMDNLLDIVPLGQLKSSWNHSTVDKRVLNADNIVEDDDNIKQDLSIDVYNRNAKEEAAAKISSEAAAALASAQQEEEEDGLDSLLAV